MLVNASRFTRVQTQMRNRLHEVLERIQNSVRINAALGARALEDPEMRALREVWVEEYSEAWDDGKPSRPRCSILSRQPGG